MISRRVIEGRALLAGGGSGRCTRLVGRIFGRRIIMRVDREIQIVS
jgi:hypothetical protein